MRKVKDWDTKEMRMGYAEAALPEGTLEKLERLEAERKFLIELVSSLREENARLNLELLGVHMEDLPF